MIPGQFCRGFYGADRRQVRVEGLEAAKAGTFGYAYVCSFEAEQTRIWKLRKAGLGLLLGMKGERKPIAFVEDCAVDPSSSDFFVGSGK